METSFLSIDYKDPLWIATAFIFGLLARWIGLPPLVGFLVAGFSLNYLGVESGFFLNEMAEIGVRLLLFSIGLKLRVKELLHAEVWGVTLVHTFVVGTLLTFGLLLLKEMKIPLFTELNLNSAMIIGFALTFSSTVFVVKILELQSDTVSQFGRLAIGVLVVQDIFAVIFLGISETKTPSAWAALVIVLIPIARPFLFKVLTKSGHGELQVLYGLVLSLGGAALFETVNLKADLGSLVFGALLANHIKSHELAEALFNIKELFLLGFFLSIGMAGFPDSAILLAVCILIPVLFIKIALFFLLFTRFKVRSGSATATSIGLGSYSEFGLIVTAVAVSHQWLSQEWIVVMALLVASSFAVSAATNNYADNFYNRFRPLLLSFQRKKRLAGDEDMNLSDVHILVCGMGRVGSGAYDHLIHQGEKNVLGLDPDVRIIMRQSEIGRKTLAADASSTDFWARLNIKNSNLEWILLCTSNLHTNVATASLARQRGFKGFISSTSHYPDEEPILRHAGVDAIFNIYAEAGVGLAQHSEEIINNSNSTLSSEVKVSHSTYRPPFNE